MPKYIQDKISADKFVVTDEGFLIFPDAKIARTGIQEYYAFELGLDDRDPLTVIKVYRPESEVFKQEAMDSFANSIVTNNHPEELVSKDNAKKFQVGYSGDTISKNGIFLTAKLIVTDADTIKDIEAGKSEISNGYTSHMDFTPGITPEGENFDVMQTNIKGNHIAIVAKGRCGPSCRVTDSLNPEKKPMPKITLDSVDYEASEQVVQAVGKLQASLDSKDEAITESKKELDKVQAQADQLTTDHKKEVQTLQAQLDDANKNQLTPEKLDALIESRSAIIMVANDTIKDYVSKDKDCEQIRKEVVAHVVGDSVNLDEKSVEYISARFDAISESAGKNKSTSLGDALKQHAKGQVDPEQNVVTSDQARENFISKSRDAWKPASQKTA